MHKINQNVQFLQCRILDKSQKKSAMNKMKVAKKESCSANRMSDEMHVLVEYHHQEARSKPDKKA